ncbi:MAG: aspartyl/asparaginyl beta-hydroxylase domain-containing protein [Halioglobus sp.]
MWITTPYRHLGSVDISALSEQILSLPERTWQADEKLRRDLAFYRETNSIFLKSIPAKTFNEIAALRPLKDSDITLQSGWESLHEQVQPILDSVVSLLGAGGIVTRIQFARMRPNSKIMPHIDQSMMLVAAHRVHVPLTTNSGIRFDIDGHSVKFAVGEIYEFNNRVVHSVANQGDTDRIHLIIDYLPAEINSPKVMTAGFDKRRKQRMVNSASPPPPPRLDYPLPTVIATSVIRGAHKDESHGGVYLIDLQSEEIEQVLDWDTCDISWEGRGWDRGLRGVAVYGDQVFIAASDELFCYDRDFNQLASWRNPYLRHAHEICLYEDSLLVTSTGFDAVLQFNLKSREFDQGWCVRPRNKDTLHLQNFNPRAGNGPAAGNAIHLNNVSRDASGLYLSGRGLPFLLHIDEQNLKPYRKLPPGIHNAMKYGGGVLYNDTNSDLLSFESDDAFCYLDVPQYPVETLLNTELGDEKLARQGFGRGLCTYREDIVIAGSSPSTVTVWDLQARAAIKSVNISMDIRNAIHGLTLWNFPD